MVDDFYLEVSKTVGLSPDSSVLVVCGGDYDRRVLLENGVEKATISNVSHHAGVKAYEPYHWEYQDAENLTAENGSYDWVFAHAGLHHCGSPHNAMCEMLRVARKGIVVVEARDSLVLRIAQKFGLTPMFELEPALLSKGEYGGYRDTPIPNYIYRWTEREVQKTVSSFEPEKLHEISYVYGWRLPTQRMTMSKSAMKRAMVAGMKSLKAVLETLLPRQGNCFGIVVRKTGKFQPWIVDKDGELAPDLDYIAKKYSAEEYKR